jgi:hypothetical protein
MSNLAEAFAAWLKSFPVPPFALSIADTRIVLSKSRSMIYEAIARGDLDGLKDGNKLLITVDSIGRYATSLPAVKIAPVAPKKWTQEAKAKRQRERQARKLASPRDQNSSAQTSP